MKGSSYKSKIIVASTLFVLFAGFCFGYGFKMFDNFNSSLATRSFDSRKELGELLAEQDNFERGKRDLNTLLEKPFQPENFFSSDTSLVREIRVLEDAAEIYDVDMTLVVTGTASNAPKAKTITEMRIIPFTMNVTGSYGGIMNYIETMEHLSFITYVKTLALGPSEKGSVAVIMSGNFYIKK